MTEFKKGTGAPMQHRMRTHQLAKEQILEILRKEQVGTLATINKDGSPYAIPVHFAYHDGKIYMHGLPAGQKVENLKRCSKVSFTVYHMDALLLDENEKPCDTNTAYRSVIVSGDASFLTETEAKKFALGHIIEKYTPQLSDKPLPENMVNGTAVMMVDITAVTGKYWE